MPKYREQLVKFGCTGLLNTAIDFLIFNLLMIVTGIHSGGFLVLFNLFAISAAMLNSFFLNSRWVFAKKQIRGQSFLRFLTSTALGMAFNNLIILAGLRLFSGLPVPAILLINGMKLLGAVGSAATNFLLYKYWVFRTPAPRPEPNPNCRKGWVSVVIPAYNEEKRLPARLRQLAASLPQLFPVEILVINDGSKDRTQAEIEAIAASYDNVHCLIHPRNLGKGAAVRTGMLAATGEYLIFTDADDTFTLEHIAVLADRLRNGERVVIGVRESEEGRRLVGESVLRRWMGKGFNRMIQFLLLPGLTDTQCGLKGFHRSIADQIFPHQRLNRFAFDVELLALARAMNCPITQLPVRAAASQDSRVNPVLSPLAMGIEVMKLKSHLFVNSYRLPGVPVPAHEYAVGFGFFFLAVGLRFPWLWKIPRFIDELKEVNLAYLIYSGEVQPLHNMAEDIGAMHNYILAGIFKLFGPNIFWPRLYVMITGALTVVLVYHLGKRLFHRNVGLIAAGLLLTNGLHILVTHMAWSNCTTPFFFTLALFATVLAEEKRSGAWLVGAGILWAATLQTHASAIVYVGITALYLLRPRFRRESGIRPRRFGAAALAFLLGYGNMLYFNWISRGGSLRWLEKKPYALESRPGLASYAENLHNMLVELVRTVSATYADYPSLLDYLLHPLFVIGLALLVYGSYQACRHGKALPVWIVTGSLLIIPWVNANYWFFLYTRYIMPVVICAVLLVAYGAYQGYRQLAETRLRGKTYVWLAAACLLLFICGQFVPYWQYCNRLSGTNYSNEMTLDVYSAINQLWQNQDTVVLLDNLLGIENDPLPFLLTLGGRTFCELTRPAPDNSVALLDHWWETIKNFPNKKLIAIIDGETYKKLKDQASFTDQPRYLSCKVLQPRSEEVGFREVYIVEWIAHRNAGVTE